MRAAILTIVGAVLMLASLLAAALALTPKQCDRLAEWVYDQAVVRDAGVARADHEKLLREANAEDGPDVVALLLRELARVYDEAKSPIAASMDSRYECYKRKGAIETEVKQGI